MDFLRSGYLYQTDNNSCGPIATLNAEIWLGKTFSETGWEVLGPRRYLLRTRHNNFPVRGTLWEDMDRTLKTLNLSNTMLLEPTLMKNELERGNALIVMVSYEDQKVIPGCRIEAHYFFVYRQKSRIMVINEDRKYFQKWETFSQTYLKNNPSDAEGNTYPRAWVISQP